MDKKQTLEKVMPPILLTAASFGIAALLMLLVGFHPMKAYEALFEGAFGSGFALITTINKSIPICIAAFAVGLAAKAGVFNIGVEGQLVMGAFGSAVAGIYITGLPAPLHLLVSMLAGAMAGGLWALLPSVLYVKRGTNLIVSAILCNNIAALLLTYLVVGPFKGEQAIPSTAMIQPTAELPALIEVPARLTVAAPLVLVIGIIYYLSMQRTVGGYELRAVGQNPVAARFVGIRNERYLLFSLVGGGMLAGIAGSIEVLGNYHQLFDGFSPGYGFDGIPIALISDGNPFIMMVGSLLFGGLRAGSQNMQMMAGVKKEIVTVIQGLLIVFIAMQYLFKAGVHRVIFHKKGGKE